MALFHTSRMASRASRQILSSSTASSLTAKHNWKLSLQIAGVQVRHKGYAPINFGVSFVPQQEAWVVERFGKFHRILEPGLNFLIPVVDRIKYVQSLKEIAIDIPSQSAITSDNVTLSLDGVLFLRILDAFKASYGVEDPEFAISQLAQTTMRSELGKLSLDKIFHERESLNVSIVESINKAALSWGITCLRYEIRDIILPARVKEAMQMQVEAERRKRAAILESEGVRTADINIAEGKRQSRILASEADKQEQINRASGEATAIMAVSEAKAKGINLVASALISEQGNRAAGLSVASDYVEAFRHLAKTNNTIILPSNAGDVSNAVVQAMSIYKQLSYTNASSSDVSSSIPDLSEYYSDDDERAQAEAKLKASTIEKKPEH